MWLHFKLFDSAILVVVAFYKSKSKSRVLVCVATDIKLELLDGNKEEGILP